MSTLGDISKSERNLRSRYRGLVLQDIATRHQVTTTWICKFLFLLYLYITLGTFEMYKRKKKMSRALTAQQSKIKQHICDSFVSHVSIKLNIFFVASPNDTKNYKYKIDFVEDFIKTIYMILSVSLSGVKETPISLIVNLSRQSIPIKDQQIP